MSTRLSWITCQKKIDHNGTAQALDMVIKALDSADNHQRVKLELYAKTDAEWMELAFASLWAAVIIADHADIDTGELAAIVRTMRGGVKHVRSPGNPRNYRRTVGNQV